MKSLQQHHAWCLLGRMCYLRPLLVTYRLYMQPSSHALYTASQLVDVLQPIVSGMLLPAIKCCCLRA